MHKNTYDNNCSSTFLQHLGTQYEKNLKRLLNKKDLKTAEKTLIFRNNKLTEIKAELEAEKDENNRAKLTRQMNNWKDLVRESEKEVEQYKKIILYQKNKEIKDKESKLIEEIEKKITKYKSKVAYKALNQVLENEKKIY